MKKVDVWIIVAVILAIVVNPDESDLWGILVLWGNVIAALCAKAIMLDNENEKNNDKSNKTTTDGA